MTESTSPGTALADRPISGTIAPILSNDEIDRMYRIAKALAMSRMFKDVTQAEQAFAKILLGRDLGISPTRAMMSIDLVRGNIQMRAVLLASFVREKPDYDYKVLEHDETKCSIEFWRRFDGEWEPMGVSTFTVEDAKKANLVKADGAWVTAPRNMVFARAMSNGVKWYCPDAMAGMPVYTEGDYIPEAEVVGVPQDAIVVSDSILPPAAIRILERARTLGHDGLSDQVTAEMTLKDQPEEFVADWCKRATIELDAMDAALKATQDLADRPLGEQTFKDFEASRNAHAANAAPEERGERASADSGVPDRPGNPPSEEPDPERPDLNNTQGMRDHANALLDQAEIIRSRGGDPDEAGILEDEAAGLMAEADILDSEA